MTSIAPVKAESELKPLLAIVVDSALIKAEDGLLMAYEVVIGSLDEPAGVVVPEWCLPPGLEAEDELIVRFERRACKVCGCTSKKACETGCQWVDADLCSQCLGPVILDPSGMPATR